MRKFFAFLLLITLLCCCSCAKQEAPTSDQQGLTVYFIDVGQADCTLISVDGKNMLIDGGNISDGVNIINFLEDKSITTLDVVVATHAHEDHIGGLSAVIDSFNVGTVYSPVDSYSSTQFSEFLDAANRQCGITLCKKDMSWQLGGASFNVLWPSEPEKQHANNSSIVLKMTYGDISFLFTGDVEKDAESQFADESIKADVLKVAHHGSNTSTSYLFLRNAQPQLAVISCGINNSYNHPHSETLEILAQADAQIMRTDQSGTITVTSDGKTFTVNGETFRKIATPIPAYIGNLKSKVFHLESCKSLPKAENMKLFSSRQDAVDQGYRPCQNCNP